MNIQSGYFGRKTRSFVSLVFSRVPRIATRLGVYFRERNARTPFQCNPEKSRLRSVSLVRDGNPWNRPFYWKRRDIVYVFRFNHYAGYGETCSNFFSTATSFFLTNEESLTHLRHYAERNPCTIISNRTITSDRPYISVSDRVGYRSDRVTENLILKVNTKLLSVIINNASKFLCI